MEVIELQLLFMGVIFISTSCVGLTPILLGKLCGKKLFLKSETKARLLSDASCFGAGVFIFVCFLGLLPAADRKFHIILEELGHSGASWEAFAEFPWGFFVVTCGFLVIFTIDKLVHALENAKSHSSENESNYITRSLISLAPTPPLEIDNIQPKSVIIPEVQFNQKSLLNYECHLEACGIYEEASNHGGVPSSLMFLVALGIHSVFEGIAVGLQTSMDKIMEYSLAVLLHEVVMALTFGLEVSKSVQLQRRVKILYVFIFTSSIPLGIGIGMGLQNAPSENRELISAIIEAFATGIFLHVIFIEILANEFPHHQLSRHKCRLTPQKEEELKAASELCFVLEKIFCIIAGFTLLILLNVFMHGHTH